jgi:hypothetical protein
MPELEKCTSDGALKSAKYLHENLQGGTINGHSRLLYGTA